jgi:hypothetical protein
VTVTHPADKFTANDRVRPRLLVLDLSPATTVPALARLYVVLSHAHLLICLVKCDDFIFFQHVFYLLWAVGIDIQIHRLLTALSGVEFFIV